MSGVSQQCCTWENPNIIWDDLELEFGGFCFVAGSESINP